MLPVDTSHLDIGALSTPCENHLLFARLTSNCFWAESLGVVGHMPLTVPVLDVAGERFLARSEREVILAHIGD